MRRIRYSRKEAARDRRNTKTLRCVADSAGCRLVPRRKHKKLKRMLVERSQLVQPKRASAGQLVQLQKELLLKAKYFSRS